MYDMQKEKKRWGKFVMLVERDWGLIWFVIHNGGGDQKMHFYQQNFEMHMHYCYESL